MVHFQPRQCLWELKHARANARLFLRFSSHGWHGRFKARLVLPCRLLLELWASRRRSALRSPRAVATPVRGTSLGGECCPHLPSSRPGLRLCVAPLKAGQWGPCLLHGVASAAGPGQSLPLCGCRRLWPLTWYCRALLLREESVLPSPWTGALRGDWDDRWGGWPGRACSLVLLSSLWEEFV